MSLTKQEWLALEKKAHELRKLCLQTTQWAGSGHIGGGLSVLDLLTVLYHKYLNIKVEDPQWEDRDRFIRAVRQGLQRSRDAEDLQPVRLQDGYAP